MTLPSHLEKLFDKQGVPKSKSWRKKYGKSKYMPKKMEKGEAMKKYDSVKKLVKENDNYSVPPQVTYGSPELGNPVYVQGVNRTFASEINSQKFSSEHDLYQKILKVLTQYNLSVVRPDGYGVSQKEIKPSLGAFEYPIAQFGEPSGSKLYIRATEMHDGSIMGNARISSGLAVEHVVNTFKETVRRKYNI